MVSEDGQWLRLDLTAPSANNPRTKVLKPSAKVSPDPMMMTQEEEEEEEEEVNQEKHINTTSRSKVESNTTGNQVKITAHTPISNKS